MAFIQIIDTHTEDLDAVLKVDEQWEAATEGKRTARRSIVCRDRNDPTHLQIVVFFDSYESAMENSNLPETQEFAQKWQAASVGGMTFYDLDVVADHS